MVKRIISFMAALALLLACAPIAAIAAGEITQTFEEGVAVEYCDGCYDTGELVSGYFWNGGIDEYSLPMLLSSDYNGDKLVGVTQKIYTELKKQIELAAKGSITSTNFNIELGASDLEGNSWTAKELGVKSLFSDAAETTINRDAAAAAAEKLLDKNRAILSVIRDCPYELYWFANQYSVQKKYSVSVKKGAGEERLSFKSMSLTAGFKVSDDYRGSNEYSINTSKTGSVNNAIANVKKVVAEASGLADYAKLNYYRQRICELASYDSLAARGSYGNAWQLINLFDGDPNTNIVCEGYAKGFQYLCELSSFSTPDLYVYSVSGEYSTGGAGGGHMWNIVHMDGHNYLVDLTNCDGPVPSDRLFMATPASGSVDSGYTFDAGGVQFTYKYYDETRLIYGDAELNLMRAPSTPAIVFNPSSVLSYGSQGDDVYQLQELLVKMGYNPGSPDGDFGGMTYNAVMQFQNDHGLLADGVVGSITVASINEQLGQSSSGLVPSESEKPSASTGTMINLSRSLSYGSYGDDVLALQKRLVELGYNPGTPDGDFGNMTRAAVIAFQNNNGLLADGIVGSITVGVLNGSAAAGGTAPSEPSETPGVSTGVAINRTLQLGSYGEDVLNLQNLLVLLGYDPGTPDGDFGNMTNNAVMAFQAAEGLYVDGVVGSITIGVLNNYFG